jgi:hypothetical protein
MAPAACSCAARAPCAPARPAPAPPARCSPARPAATALIVINQLVAAIGRVNVNDAPIARFNFNARYLHIHTETPTLTDGHPIVIRAYYLPTQHVSSYYAQVSPDRMTAIFGVQIPRLFANVFTCTLSELDPFEPDFAAILAAMWETVSCIALAHDNFDSILPPGQQDPLPFACMQDPIITHVLQLGDERLYKQLSLNPSSNPKGLRQMQLIVRVEYKGQERAHVGMAQGGIQVILCRSPPPPPAFSHQSAQQAAAAQQAAQQAAAAQHAAQQAVAAQQAAQKAAAAQQVAQQAAAAQHAAQQAVAAQQVAQQAAAAQQAAQQAAAA